VIEQQLQPPTPKPIVVALYYAGLARPRNRPEVDLSPHAMYELWRPERHGGRGYLHKDFKRVLSMLADRARRQIVLPGDIEMRASSGLIVPATHQ
jgi:hypothetical protein